MVHSMGPTRDTGQIIRTGDHIHSATEKAQDEGRKAEYYAKLASSFGNFGEAINEIVRNIGMNDTEIEKYFPIDKPMGLEF